MSTKHIYFVIFIFTALTELHAAITLPAIFSENMVLQRNAEVLLYGWASPNEKFELFTSWNDKTIHVTAAKDANWQIQIPTPSAGGPYIIRFMGEENTIEFSNVMVGDVWLCSGQSNMEWSANSGIDNQEQEIQNANHPNIRLFRVQKRTSSYPQDNVSGTWKECSSETMPHFSAVAYFFAKKVQKELGVPIGLIDASWGASCAEVWTPDTVFSKYPALVSAHNLLTPNQWVSNERSSLYNAMIAPLTKFRIEGVLWYQGETNTGNAEGYQDLLTQMISAWRDKWNINFPFYFAQIAPFQYERPHEGALLRDQQRRTLSLEKTGMAMTSDICTVNDIHPKNKKDVGVRLANIALKQHYGFPITEDVYGPLPKTATLVNNGVLVVFNYAHGLYLKNKNEQLFEVMDASGKWYVAKLRIKENAVWLTSKQVKQPKAVRYAWRSSDTSSLFNKAGLPTSSFQIEVGRKL